MAVAAEQPVAPAAVAAVATGGWGAATTSAPTATAVSGGSSGWGSGGTTLAEKLKQAEIQKLLPPPAPVVEVNVVDENEVIISALETCAFSITHF